MDRLERLLDLAHVLQSAREPLSLDQLKEIFDDYAVGSHEAVRRKFERDKAELASIGLVLRVALADEGAAEGYRLDAEASYLPEISLEADERDLLAAAGRAALANPAFPHRRALRLALAKLDADDVPATTLAFHHGSVDPGEPVAERVETLGRALASRKRVTLRHRKPGAEAVEREVDPWALFLDRGAWYLTGFDHRAGERRVFRASRIEEVTLNPKRPKSPDFEVPEDFETPSSRSLDPLHFAIHPEAEARVRVDPEVSFLMEPAWGAPDSDGVFTVRTTHLAYLVEQVLGLGHRAELLAPPEGREAMAVALEAVLDAHLVVR